MTHEKAADAVGHSRVAVSNLLRLLTLSEPVQEMLLTGKLDMGHARALIGLGGAQQVMLAEQIILNNSSVRDAENLVKTHHEKTSRPAKKTAVKARASQDVLRLEQELSDKVGANVTIGANAKGVGTLKINYASLEQLEGIVAKLMR